ncbi:MAG: ABC transporter permease [Treponema sp.]|nr:ABC transporter permease [Treponema sp.]MCR5622256.1 ABC transporter permease [Treponema sp.]
MARVVGGQKEKWTKVISAQQGLLDLHLMDVVHYRDLIFLLIKRDWTVTYKQTVLGPLWYVMQPLISAVMYTFVFGKLAGLGTDGIPYVLFYFPGNMLWLYFNKCVTCGANTFIENRNVFSKVYFPRLCVPIADVVGQILRLLIQFACLLCIYFYFLAIGTPITPSWKIAFFPLLLLWIGGLGMGLGLILSALTTKYRDLNNLVTFLMPLAMYVTPVVYPLSQAPEKYRLFFMINPMSAPVEAFRIWFYGAGNVTPSMYAVSIAATCVILFVGLVLFTRGERTFVDVI